MYTAPRTMPNAAPPKQGCTPHTTQTITAHFSSLRRALAEARRYGVTAALPTVQRSIQSKGVFLHYLSVTRILSISKARGSKQWQLAVDVAGRVVPVDAKPASVPVEGTLTAEPRQKTAMPQAFVEAVYCPHARRN